MRHLQNDLTYARHDHNAKCAEGEEGRVGEGNDDAHGNTGIIEQRWRSTTRLQPKCLPQHEHRPSGTSGRKLLTASIDSQPCTNHPFLKKSAPQQTAPTRTDQIVGWVCGQHMAASEETSGRIPSLNKNATPNRAITSLRAHLCVLESGACSRKEGRRRGGRATWREICVSVCTCTNVGRECANAYM